MNYDLALSGGRTSAAVAFTTCMRAEMRQHHALGDLAGKQYGVVTHDQLLRLGYASSSIDRAVSVGRLYRLLRGTYSVGHPVASPHGRCLAAVLACGNGALLSHHSAAWLWGLHPECPIVPHVTVPQRGHNRNGVQLHHSTILKPEDRTEVEAIPSTSVARTLLDLAGNRGRQLDSIVEKADRMELLDLDALDLVLARAGGHRGRDPLRQALDLYREPIFTRARSERLVLAMVKLSDLPRPKINFFLGEYELDAYWENERFALEVDGWGTHRTRAAFERDPLRIENLKLSGVEAIRITARRLEREPLEFGRRLHILLERRRLELAAHPGGAVVGPPG
jgi:very-short-patch-repair endonuclease